MTGWNTDGDTSEPLVGARNHWWETAWWMKSWWFNHPISKDCWGTPRSKWLFLARTIIERNGGLSSHVWLAKGSRDQGRLLQNKKCMGHVSSDISSDEKSWPQSHWMDMSKWKTCFSPMVFPPTKGISKEFSCTSSKEVFSAICWMATAAMPGKSLEKP